MSEPVAKDLTETVAPPGGGTRRSFWSRHPRWMRLFAVCLSLGGTLGVLEIGVRVFCPRINFVGESGALFRARKFGETFGYVANVTGTSWGAELVTDRLGFRSASGADATAARTLPSILIVGDSVPNGIGVDFPRTLSSLLGARLSKRIVNTSVTGYGAVDYENVVRHFVLDHHATLDVERVLLFVTLNDLVGGSADAIRASLDERGAAREPSPTAFAERVDSAIGFNSWLIGRSKLYLLLKSFAYDASKRWFRADEVRFHDDRLVEALSTTVQSIDRMLASVGVPLTIVVLPYEFQLREPSADVWFPQQRLREAFLRAKLSVLDLSDDFRAAMKRDALSSKDFFLFNDHCHLSARGHALVSDVLSRALAATGDGR